MPVEPDANDLLSRDPLALLIAMLLDQQVPLERAFSAPYDLTQMCIRDRAKGAATPSGAL